MSGKTTHKPEYDEQAMKYCLLGATNVQLAEMFGVAVSTIDKWIKDIPTFSGAVKEGREAADARVAHSLYHRACGYSHPEDKILSTPNGIEIIPTTKHYPPDATSMIFWLKNRQRANWRDKIDTELTGKDGGPIQGNWTVEFVNATPESKP